MSRLVGVFGQYGAVADPIFLPSFVKRVADRGVETILVQHFDSKAAYDFLHGYSGRVALVGSSLGAMSVVVFAGYLHPQRIDFIGGFQPSDWDPSGHAVFIRDPNGDTITRAITVPSNVQKAVVFRNPVAAATGGLGHATWVLDPASNHTTDLKVIPRADVHAGDFPPAADIMFDQAMEALNA